MLCLDQTSHILSKELLIDKEQFIEELCISKIVMSKYYCDIFMWLNWLKWPEISFWICGFD